MTTATADPDRDTLTMLRRRLLHLRRYPTLTVMLVGMPVLSLVLFVYVFGGTLGNGLGPTTAGRHDYVQFLAPAILVIAVASVANGTAGAVATDITGVIARFRTMAIARSSVLAGHVLGSLVQSAIGVIVALVVAFAIGYRPDATTGEWLGALAVLALVAIALSWLTVAFGLAARTVESATNLPMLLVLLPFLGSGFVPTASMPTALRVFAERQPFTPMIDAMRGLLSGAPQAGDISLAVAWSIVLAAIGWTCPFGSTVVNAHRRVERRTVESLHLYVAREERHHGGVVRGAGSRRWSGNRRVTPLA
jgi:ABC-2 type transport system permease protein